MSDDLRAILHAPLDLTPEQLEEERKHNRNGHAKRVTPWMTAQRSRYAQESGAILRAHAADRTRPLDRRRGG